MNTDYTIVIPARYASSRFPGKPLHPLAGRPLLLHALDRARESAATEVIVATDDERIAALCEREGVAVAMTAASHPSGTDRIAEVADQARWPDERVIVGMQGDEPLTRPAHLDQLAENLAAETLADMATLAVPLHTAGDFANPNRVKVVRDCRGMALYFSRASIPAWRDVLLQADAADTATRVPPSACLHLGLYAYRRGFLRRYQTLPVCELEQLEQLEQLRVLYNGYRIHVGLVEDSAAQGVDHPDDVARVEQLLRQYRA